MMNSCENLTKPTDITDHYNYKDNNGDDKKQDGKFVSCGQDGSYNEVKYIYDKIRSNFRGLLLSEAKILTAICECCRELDNPRKRGEFYTLLNDKLGTTLSFKD